MTISTRQLAKLLDELGHFRGRVAELLISLPFNRFIKVLARSSVDFELFLDCLL